MTLMWLNNVNLLVTRTISYWWNISSLHSLPEWSFDLGYTHNTHGISTFPQWQTHVKICQDGWSKEEVNKMKTQHRNMIALEAKPDQWTNGAVEEETSSKNGGGSRVQTRRQRIAVEWSCAPKVGNVALTKRTRLPRGAIVKKKVHTKEPHWDISCHQRVRNTFQELVYGYQYKQGIKKFTKS